MTDTTNVGQAFWDYPFDSDEEYQVRLNPYRASCGLDHWQQGLSSILHGSVSSGTSPEEVKEILLRSRLFFFNRCGSFVSGLSVPHTTTQKNRLYNHPRRCPELDTRV
jgi:hypothetical protein